MSSSTWALSQLSQLLHLDEDSLKQILDYTTTLPKDAAAEHLKNLLGDSPKALEFISTFNSRREAALTSSAASANSRINPRPKKKPQLNNLPPPRRVENSGNTSGAYQKKAEEDYMSNRRPGQQQQPGLSNTLALSEKPEARQSPKPTRPSSKPPPSASGPLISDLPNVRTGARTPSRTASPAPKTKVTVAGGAPMHGASTTLQDLDSAIRTLEQQTNPTRPTSPSRACNCMSTRHPLLAAAPNCLNCGKIICVKEGLGPCTFCGHPLLSSSEMQGMIESLRQERGVEKMHVHNAGQRRADVAATPRSGPPTASTSTSTPTPTSTSTSSSSKDPAPGTTTLKQAQAHRDKLLTYQSQNTQRTHIIDQAADFETPASGPSMWASPTERAAQLKRQQRVMREQAWVAKPEWEKRRVVVSVDLVGGRVVRRMGEVERGDQEEEEDRGFVEEEGGGGGNDSGGGGGGGGGAFSRNPLMGSLIRPVWKGKGEDEDEDKENANGATDAESETRSRGNMWRRVQDDNDDDNEALILDGGIYGGRDREEERAAG